MWIAASLLEVFCESLLHMAIWRLCLKRYWGDRKAPHRKQGCRWNWSVSQRVLLSPMQQILAASQSLWLMIALKWLPKGLFQWTLNSVLVGLLRLFCLGPNSKICACLMTLYQLTYYYLQVHVPIHAGNMPGWKHAMLETCRAIVTKVPWLISDKKVW